MSMYKPFSFKPRQGLAYRAEADVELLTQIADNDSLARTKLTLQDAGAQGIPDRRAMVLFRV